jgi:hypothetical protein
MLSGCVFLAFGVFALVTREGWRPSPPPLFVALAIAELGAALFYVGLANVVNVTRVTMTPTTVVREDGPLPWRRRRELLRSQIDVRARITCRYDPRRGGRRGLPPEEPEVVGESTPELATVLFDLLDSRERAERVASAVHRVMTQYRP